MSTIPRRFKIPFHSIGTNDKLIHQRDDYQRVLFSNVVLFLNIPNYDLFFKSSHIKSPTYIVHHILAILYYMLSGVSL